MTYLKDSRHGQMISNEPVIQTARLDLALAKLAAAAGLDPGAYASNWESLRGQQLNMNRLDRWEELMKEALQAVGKVTVRYLGDLKESTYPLSVRFFHAKSGDSDEDFHAALRKAIASGEGARRITFVNLANVREVAVDLGNPSIPQIEADIAWMESSLAMMRSWSGILVWN